MPPITGNILDFFRDQGNIQVTAAEQLDARTVDNDLFFLPRTATQNVRNHELRARWRGSAVIADMIALDSRSTVYKMLKIKSAETEIFKIKFGTFLSEDELDLVLSLGQAELNATGQVPDFVRRLLMTLSRQLDTGRRWRLEEMIIGAKLNTFHYDRMNYKVDGTWGMSATMIVTPEVPWTDPDNCTPITDTVSQIDYARVAKGQRLNRWVSSTPAFDAAVASDEFQAKAAFYLPNTITFANLPVLDRDLKIDLFKRMTRLDEIVLYDGHSRWEDEGGNRYLRRRQPINAVILEDTANDNNPDRLFLGNGQVMEAAMIGRVGARAYDEGAGPEDVGPGRTGPFYYTDVPHDLDPPRINARVVQKTWPIKPDPDCNAVLWVGPIQETIAVSDAW
jgi:hypothetical protein